MDVLAVYAAMQSVASGPPVETGVTVDAHLVQILVPTVLVALGGGIVAAIMPVDEKSWGVWQALRLIFLGMAVGTMTGLFLMDHWRWLHDTGDLVVVFISGLLAYPIVRQIQKAGPRRLLEVLLRGRPQIYDVDEGKGP